MDNIEERNSMSGYLEGNWQPVTKEIHRAVCKVGRGNMETCILIKTCRTLMVNCAGGGDDPSRTWRRTLPQDRIKRPLLAPHRFFILGTEEKVKVFESLS